MVPPFVAPAVKAMEADASPCVATRAVGAAAAAAGVTAAEAAEAAELPLEFVA
jgi:hypothetical protein